MKKAALLLSACGLVLSGNLLGRATTSSSVSEPEEAETSGQLPRAAGGENTERRLPRTPRNGIAQANFTSGGACQWMGEMQRRAGDGNSLPSRMRILETCNGMDAASARKTATEAVEILRNLRDDDPAAKADFPSRDLQMQMVNGALYRLAQLEDPDAAAVKWQDRP